MVVASSSQSKRIVKAASLLSDQKRVDALIQLLVPGKETVTEIHRQCPGQHFSSCAKRFSLLEARGMVSSKKTGAIRHYQVIGAQKLVDAFDALSNLATLIR